MRRKLEPRNALWPIFESFALASIEIFCIPMTLRVDITFGGRQKFRATLWHPGNRGAPQRQHTSLKETVLLSLPRAPLQVSKRGGADRLTQARLVPLCGTSRAGKADYRGHQPFGHKSGEA